MSLYWAISSLSGLAQNIALRFPALRRALSIPQTPSERASPMAELSAIAREKQAAFWKEVREKNDWKQK